MCDGAPSITTVRATQRADTLPVVRFSNKPRMSMTGPGAAGAVGMLSTVLVVKPFGIVTIEPLLSSLPLSVACPCRSRVSCRRSEAGLGGLLPEKLGDEKKPGSATGIAMRNLCLPARSPRGRALAGAASALSIR
eukprot:scaffold122002_cov63-Phaeocystis_antarctica.AAC.1